jgi:hypothetical protein
MASLSGRLLCKVFNTSIYMKRELGFYWVTIDRLGGIDTSGKLFVGFYDSDDDDWMLPGVNKVFKDKHFSHINEERILPPQN